MAIKSVFVENLLVAIFQRVHQGSENAETLHQARHKVTPATRWIPSRRGRCDSDRGAPIQRFRLGYCQKRKLFFLWSLFWQTCFYFAL